jgi:large conductance mechanosensitive channel
LKEFREFLLRQNAFALAIGVIIGSAVGKVVSGIVDDLVMPIVGVILPGGDWRNAQLQLTGANAIKYGDLIGRVVDFVFIAAVVYVLAKLLLASMLAPATRELPGVPGPDSHRRAQMPRLRLGGRLIEFAHDG